MDHLKLGRVVLVGNSLGGPVSLEAARRLGKERVLGVVVVDTLHDVEQRWPADALRKTLDAYRADFRNGCQDLMLGLLPDTATASTRERIRRETCANDPVAAIALLETSVTTTRRRPCARPACRCGRSRAAVSRPRSR
jgi:pimeloyl-ACP methyl ester carboxylesterase